MGFQKLTQHPLVFIGIRFWQAIWAAALLGCSAYLVNTWRDEIEDLDVNPARYTGPMTYGIFVGAAALAAAVGFQLAWLPPKWKLCHIVKRVMLGITDLVVSCLLAVLSFAAAAALGRSPALRTTCIFSSLPMVVDMDDAWAFRRVCSSSRLAIAAAAFLLLLFVASAVVAYGYMRAGYGLLPLGERPAAADEGAAAGVAAAAAAEEGEANRVIEFAAK